MKIHRRNDQAGASGLPSGFTLLELLVAVALLMMVVVLLANVLGSATNISSQASARLNATRLGREVFDLIERDLSQMVTTRPSLGTNSPLQFTVNPSQIGSSYRNAAAVFWQSSIARDQTAGNVAVVGYFVQRPDATHSQLRRVLIEPTDPLYQIYSVPANSLPATTVDSFAASAGSATSSKLDRGWLADGVIGLWVRCLDANGNVIETNGAGAAQGYAFDSRQGYQSGAGTNKVAYSTFNALPAFVDIGLVCVAPKDADRIDSLPAATAASPQNFAAEMDAYVTAFSAANPRVKTVTALTRRFRLYGAN